MSVFNQDQAAKEIKELSKLVDINQDACEFYTSAQEKVENPRHKSTFRELDQLHKSAITSIQQLMTKSGADTNKSKADETVTGKATRMFGELASKLSSNTDSTLISRLEEAEDRCLHSMEDAIKNEDVSADTRGALQNELSKLRKSHDHMKALKESMAA